MLGSRKYQITVCSYPDLPEAILDKPLLKGSKHSDRMVIQTLKMSATRKFSGVSCDQKKKKGPES